jgi:hypothetical protein
MGLVYKNVVVAALDATAPRAARSGLSREDCRRTASAAPERQVQVCSSADVLLRLEGEVGKPRDARFPGLAKRCSYTFRLAQR